MGRFLFPGSCSVYGAGEKLDLAEEAPFNPISCYAKSKIEAEQSIRELADEVSRRYLSETRRPTGVADAADRPGGQQLLASAMAYSESPDSVGRFAMAAADPLPRIYPGVRGVRQRLRGPCTTRSVNVGGNSENYQVTRCRRRSSSAGAKSESHLYGRSRQRSTQLSRAIRQAQCGCCPISIWSTTRAGMEELHRSMLQHGFGKSDFEGDRFVRLRTLKKRLGLDVSRHC